MAARKISVRKIIQTLVTLVAVIGCALAMISADQRHAKKKVKAVKLVVKSPAGVHFLTEEAVERMLFTGRHISPQKLSIAHLDERSMEAILSANPWVRDAEVFTDGEQVMHITLTQRVPVVRLFETNGNSYYLDAALQAMPLSSQYTHYTPVVTGVPKLGTDSAAMAVKGQIVGLVSHIQRDTFWNAQVTQIDMRADGGFELLPVLGKQRIILGDTARVTKKLENLFAFYKQVQNKVGWDKYNTIDLRYDGQVVASPALPWKAPVDRAISNMSWLQAIMDNAPKQTQLGGDAAAWSDSTGNVASTPAPAPAQQVSKPPPVKPPAAVLVKKPTLQAANKAPKPKLPAAVSHAKVSKPQQHPKNTSSHKQNTPPHAATNR